MRTITGLFDSRPEAERAVEAMVQEYGIDRDRVQVHAAGPDNATAGTMEARSEAHHGFLASLKDISLPPEEQARYSEGMRRGGILVSAEVPDDKLERASDSFKRNGAVDLKAREAEWRQGGWTGTASGAGASTAAISGAASDTPSAPDATYAGTGYVGTRGTDTDHTKPVNAGIASSPPVRPAGPAAMEAAKAGASTAEVRETERAAAAAGPAATPATPTTPSGGAPSREPGR